MKNRITKLRYTTPLAILLVSVGLHAQDTPAPELIPNLAAAIERFEPPANAPYQLGRGDQITVDAAGRPDLTGKHLIGPDGKITMPVAGPILIVDLTRDQAAGAIEHALDPYYTNLAISVSVDKYTSNGVIVLGAVGRPGMIAFDRTPTLLQAVSRATSGGGGSDSSGNSNESYNSDVVAGGQLAQGGTRSTNIPEEVTIYRGSTMRLTVQLRALVEEGSPLANMRLKRDDIIFVSGKTSYITILGEVYRPGNVRLDKATTLVDLIAQAGGPTERGGRDPKIDIIHQVIKNGPSIKRTLTYKQIREDTPLDITLQSGDIVYVRQSGYNGLSYAFQQLAPLVNLFTIVSLIGGTGSL